jgi:hypothetical protein
MFESRYPCRNVGFSGRARSTTPVYMSPWYRSHFGSRYTSGRCALRSPFFLPNFRYTSALQAKFKCRIVPALYVCRNSVRLLDQCACNLPGWRWATITKVALDRLSRSLHSDVCDSDGLRDAAIHSTISGRGGRRDCATSNILIM